MGGDARRTGGGAAEVTADLRAGYDAAAPHWADGPGPVYGPLAQTLVAAAPVPLAGALVLDLGAGTGLAGRAALAAGAAQVVAADLSLGMLRHARDSPGPDSPGPDSPGPDSPGAGLGHGAAWAPVVADAVALPFRDRRFDLVAAAFCLNHLDSLAAGLTEMRRVSGAIAASVFAPGWSHPALNAVEDVLSSFGYQPPAWHSCLSPGSRAGDPELLAAAAAAAGFADVRVRTMEVSTALVTPAQLASWRLGLAQVAPFLSSLDTATQAGVRQAAEQAVAVIGSPEAAPLVVSIVVLTAS